MKAMKNTTRLIVILCFICFTISGCDKPVDSLVSVENSTGNSLPFLNVCVDVPSSRGSSWENFLSTIRGNGKDFIVITETIPAQGSERDASLTHLRTEIMAGKGPDVLICDCIDPYFIGTGKESQALFPFPENAMDSRIFLPLDEYIADSDSLEWDNQLPNIMAAGKNEEGQQLLPFSYSFTVAAFDREQYNLSEDLPMTWNEMLESTDPLVQYAAGIISFPGAMGKVADYEAEEPAFSESDLLTCAEQIWGQKEKQSNGQLSELMNYDAESGFYDPKDGVEYINFSSYELAHVSGHVNLGASDKEYHMVPIYNTSGGVTAKIIAFTAINRNTNMPDEAFKVIETLFSRSIQQNSALYNSLSGIPPHVDVGSSDAKFNGWSINEWNSEQFKFIRDQINVVQFYTPLDVQLETIIPARYNSEQSLEKIVHDVYATMRMMLAES